MPRPWSTLRGRVAMLATLAVGAVLLAVGATSVASFADRERARVDDDLRLRPVPELVRALGGEPQRPGFGAGGMVGPLPGYGPPSLRHGGEYVRLIAGGAVAATVDAPDGLPVPDRPGLRTVSAGGDRYRSLVRPVGNGAFLEVGAELASVDARVGALRGRLLLLGALGLAAVAAASWWLAGLALRPLGALSAAAGRVSSTRDLSTRVSADDAPAEVGALAGSMNAMLARLERSAAETDAALQATRRFAADAGHELRTPLTALQANLGILRRNPDLGSPERLEVLRKAEAEAARAARLLETLQTLARGDAAATLPRQALDLAALVETALESARARHPRTTWSLEAPPDELELHAWPDGVRALVDNLLENAARHGRADGVVAVGLGRKNGALVLTVDDDGPGVPAGERGAVFERFVRGAGTQVDGSGLGLALVRQQAVLHGGEVTLEDAPLGGARFRVRMTGLPDGPPAGEEPGGL